MPSPIAFEIPEFFTPQYYLEQKSKRKSDEDIAEELEISKPLLDKWKRKRKCVGIIKTSMSGRKPTTDPQEAVKLFKSGLNQKEISAATGLNVGTIRKYLRLANLIKQ